MIATQITLWSHRVGWGINLSDGGIPIVRLSEKSAIGFNLALMNKGFIYDTDTDRFKHRNWSLEPKLGLTFAFGNDPATYNYLYVSYGIDINLHYKSKIFENKNRSEKRMVYEEWFSNRVNPIMQNVEVIFLFSNSIYVTGTYYFTDFFNQDFEETIDGVTTRPYQSLSVNRFELGLGISIPHLLRRLDE